MKASDFDKQFDSGKSVIRHLDLHRAKRLNTEQKRVNVDFPIWMIELLDDRARKLGVTRQSVIKMWLAERLQQSEL